MNYRYISKVFYNLPVYYIIFFGVLSFILFIEFFNFNENLLIGGLFTIGTFTTIQFSRYVFINNLKKKIIELKEVYDIRQKFVYKYKFFFLKMLTFYLFYFIKGRFNLINKKFKLIFKKLLIKLKKFKYYKIFIKILFSNYLNKYFILEKSSLLFFWLNSIKVAFKLI